MVLSRRFNALSYCLCLSFIVVAAQLSRAEEPKTETGVIEATEVTVETADDDTSVESNGKTEKKSKDDSDATGEQPTHKQSALININAEGLAPASVQCFCLMGDDQLLAGCTGASKEIRIFNAEGKYLKSLEVPVAPEAINIASDGTILVAGEGKLLRLKETGEIVTEVESPHAAAIRDAKKQVREQTIEQHKEQAKMLPEILGSYDTAIKGLEEQIAALEKQKDSEEQLKSLKEMIRTMSRRKHR